MKSSLISQIDWQSVDAKTNLEQAKREHYAPWVGVFRWWARRPSAVVGAILDAGKVHFGSKYLVADFFSGGGTVAFEAAARQLPVYAQDLYPWATNGLATGLLATEPEAFRRGAADLLDALEPQRKKYATSDGHELSHVMRVRTAACPVCDGIIHLFRNVFLSMRSRSPGERYGFLGCTACGKASLRTVPVNRFTCDWCRMRSCHTPKPVHGRPRIQCPHCSHILNMADLLSEDLRWKPVLVQEVNTKNHRGSTAIRPVRDGDPTQDDAVKPQIPGVNARIPNGIETGFLCREGFQKWTDLFTRRQLRVLKSAIGIIKEMHCGHAVKERLRVMVLGACEMAAFLTRWEAHHPKAIEAIANHRYARITLAAETNLLSTIGRGTLPRRIAATQRAVDWHWLKNCDPLVRIVSSSARRRPHDGGILVAVGSSKRQVLTDNQVDLIVTDPPYHDDVQYGELARLFHVWLAAAGNKFAVRESEEVVPNKYRGRGAEWYCSAVTECLTEGHRTLKRNGRLVLTYHNNDLNAWRALGQALKGSGFAIIALAIAAAENPHDHSKRGRRVFLHDLVIECAPMCPSVKDHTAVLVGYCDTNEAKNLLAAGMTISESSSYDDERLFRERYKVHLKQLGAQTQLIH